MTDPNWHNSISWQWTLKIKYLSLKREKKSRSLSSVVAYSGHAYFKFKELRLEKVGMKLEKTVVEGRLEKR